MSNGDGDSNDVAPIASEHLITELEFDKDYSVYAVRLAVEHRTAGRIELWQEDGTGQWKVVDLSRAKAMVLSWTTGKFDDSPPVLGDNVHRYLVSLSEAQQFAYRILRGWARRPRVPGVRLLTVILAAVNVFEA